MKTLVRILVIFVCLFSLISTLTSCDKIFPDNNPPENCQHIYGDWSIVKEGYCEERVFQRSCHICGIVENRRGEEADHFFR